MTEETFVPFARGWGYLFLSTDTDSVLTVESIFFHVARERVHGVRCPIKPVFESIGFAVVKSTHDNRLLTAVLVENPPHSVFFGMLVRRRYVDGRERDCWRNGKISDEDSLFPHCCFQRLGVG